MPDIDQWRMMWGELGATSCDEGLFGELIARYSEPHRHYHTTRHLDECFAKLPVARSEAVHLREIELALWFHDAIYDVKRSDNEEQSADWARSAVLRSGLSIDAAERIHGLVMATRHDFAPVEPDARVLVDIDLSILGAAPHRFDEYELQVREEYAWVPGILFRRKRRQILEDFLARSRIFNTEQFFQTCEARARANLQRSIRQLG
jgi:predicted metal-dependent HD superfamily phosphohydrolase